MPNTYSGLAREIFSNEFDSNTGITTFSQISGWMSSHLGDLNVLLNTSFSGVDPAIDLEAGAILKNLYMQSYYARGARNALRGIISSDGGSSVLSVKDNDNTIAFTNKNEVAKVWKSLATDMDATIKDQVYAYTMYEAAPRQVVGLEGIGSGVYFALPNWPAY